MEEEEEEVERIYFRIVINSFQRRIIKNCGRNGLIKIIKNLLPDAEKFYNTPYREMNEREFCWEIYKNILEYEEDFRGLQMLNLIIEYENETGIDLSEEYIKGLGKGLEEL